ncbi:abortive infection family protein [Gracilibacillus saliphilus]|uniref:abortive infection family protein n=1 Tax=Gracilibacillus saliphilus TaxID=543890 RepID=UPI0013D70FE8|nr:abortive infection family protein [Gracilibacillus saliphilus]
MQNTTIDFLEECKENLRETFRNHEVFNTYEIDYNEFLSDQEFRKARQLLKKLSEKIDIDFPPVLESNRTVEEFCLDLQKQSVRFDDYLSAISNIFNLYINYLEDNMYEVELIKIDCEIPQELTFERIVNDFKNCDDRILKGDYPGAITSARSLIEGVCKEILIINNIDVNKKNNNVPSLFKEVRNVLNLDASNDKLEEPLKNVITGLNKVVTGLNEIRNLSGDGHIVKKKPSKHHAVLTVNASKTVVNFLFETYKYQRDRGILQIERRQNKG